MTDSEDGQDFSASLIRYQDYLVTNLPDNLNESLIERLEDTVLELLASDKKIKGLLLGLDAVTTTDPVDLQRLRDMLSSAILLGAKVGIFGMNPGLAAIIIKTNTLLPVQVAGHDLEDALSKLK